MTPNVHPTLNARDLGREINVDIWSNKPPTEPGFYWWKQGNRVEPCKIFSDETQLIAMFFGEDYLWPRQSWQSNWEFARITPPKDLAASMSLAGD